MNRNIKGATTTELGLLAGLIAIIVVGAISTTGNRLEALFQITENNLNAVITGNKDTLSRPNIPEPIPPEAGIYHSCKELFEDPESPMSGDGLYTITPDGNTDINVYCKGAATLIVAQFESDPVRNWNEGRQSDYDPSLTSRKSFAFSNSEIPPHNKIHFGTGTSPTKCIEGITYQTGDIAAIIADACDDPTTKYILNRRLSGFYPSHNPDTLDLRSDPEWNNTLSLELHTLSGSRQTTNDYSWAFSPQNPIVVRRSYSYNGFLADTSFTVPWTVWVE